MRGKRVFAGLLFAVMLSLLCGCSKGTTEGEMKNSSEEEETEEVVTVRLLHIWQEHEGAMEKLLTAFQNKNEGIEVEVSTADWNDLNRTVQTALNAGDMYDVFFQYASRIVSLEKEGLLLDLTPYMDEEWENRFQNGALSEYTVGDGLFGIPFRGSGVVILFNTDLFEKNGWDQPKTTNELVSLMGKIKAAGWMPLSAAGKPDGFQLDSLRGILTNYIAEQKGELSDPERLNGRKTDWQGELATGAQMVKNWAEKGYFGSNPLSVDRESAMENFLSGKSAMLLCNTNEFYQIRNQTDYEPFAMDCFLVPAPEGCTESLFTDACFQDGFVVWSGTKHPEESVKLLQGLSDPEACAQWAEDTLSVVAVREAGCGDEMVNKFNSFFRMAGKYRVTPDYALGDSEEEKSQLFVSYMTSDMTADEYETNYERITADAIRASEK